MLDILEFKIEDITYIISKNNGELRIKAINGKHNAIIHLEEPVKTENQDYIDLDKLYEKLIDSFKNYNKKGVRSTSLVPTHDLKNSPFLTIYLFYDNDNEDILTLEFKSCDEEMTNEEDIAFLKEEIIGLKRVIHSLNQRIKKIEKPLKSHDSSYSIHEMLLE